MDQVYRYKLIKLAIATPLALSVTLVLNIQASLSFFGPLYIFVVVWLFPDPIELKQIIIGKMIALFTVTSVFAAFIAGMTEVNSVIILAFVLLTGWVVKTWLSVSVRLGLLSLGIYLGIPVLVSSAPYTTAVYIMTLILVGVTLGWLVDRLFWPVYSSKIVEKQVSQLFHLLETLNRSILSPSGDQSDSSSLTLQIKATIKGIGKAFKIATMTNSLSSSEQQRWGNLIQLQRQIFLHLQELGELIQKYQYNPLLNQLRPELSDLNQTLSQTFLALATITLDSTSNLIIPNPNLNLQQWQNKLNEMRDNGETQSFNLTSRLIVGLIEHRLEGLVKTLCETITFLETSRSQVSSTQLELVEIKG
ncbi:MAG: hypothetical protein AB4058_14220 [Microcystaceae cyanobacterium]